MRTLWTVVPDADVALVLLVGKAERTRERLKGDYRFSWGDVPGEGESSKEEGTGRRGQLRAQKTIPTSARPCREQAAPCSSPPETTVTDPALSLLGSGRALQDWLPRSRVLNGLGHMYRTKLDVDAGLLLRKPD